MNAEVSQINQEESKTMEGEKALAQLERASALMATATVLENEGRLPRIGALEQLTDKACSLIIKASVAERKKLRPALERLMNLTDLFADVSRRRLAAVSEEKYEKNEGENE